MQLLLNTVNCFIYLFDLVLLSFKLLIKTLGEDLLDFFSKTKLS